MGKSEKKGNKPASAARANQMAVQQNGSNKGLSPIGFGFGGYVGSQTLSSALGASGVEVSPVLDPELQLHVKGLSKKDPTTMTRALQSLRELIGGQDESQLQLLLPIWASSYPRLALDNARSVREASARLQAALSIKAGKSLASVLKRLIGPWILQQHDFHPEVSKAANMGLTAVFPGEKLVEAFNFCSTQVFEYFLGLLDATPESLGDIEGRETPEELQERHERTLASSLQSLAVLVDEESLGELGIRFRTLFLRYSKPSEDDFRWIGEYGMGVSNAKLLEFMAQAAFWKKFLASKSTLIRRQTYNFVTALARRSLFLLFPKEAKGLLQPGIRQSAPRVFGSLLDKEASNHQGMWGMILTYCNAFPESFHAINFQKALLPALTGFLKNACHGSGGTSYPAIYPFLTCFPISLLLSNTGPMQDILTSILTGLYKLGPGQLKLKELRQCFLECLRFVIRKVPELEGVDGIKHVPGLMRTIVMEVYTENVLSLAFSRQAQHQEMACILFAEGLILSNSTDASQGSTQEQELFKVHDDLLSLLLMGFLQTPKDNAQPGIMSHLVGTFKLHAQSFRQVGIVKDLRLRIAQPLLESLTSSADLSAGAIGLIASIMDELHLAPKDTESLLESSIQCVAAGEQDEGNSDINAYLICIANCISLAPDPPSKLVDVADKVRQQIVLTGSTASYLKTLSWLLDCITIAKSSKRLLVDMPFGSSGKPSCDSFVQNLVAQPLTMAGQTSPRMRLIALAFFQFWSLREVMQAAELELGQHMLEEVLCKLSSTDIPEKANAAKPDPVVEVLLKDIQRTGNQFSSLVLGFLMSTSVPSLQVLPDTKQMAASALEDLLRQGLHDDANLAPSQAAFRCLHLCFASNQTLLGRWQNVQEDANHTQDSDCTSEQLLLSLLPIVLECTIVESQIKGYAEQLWAGGQLLSSTKLGECNPPHGDDMKSGPNDVWSGLLSTIRQTLARLTGAYLGSKAPILQDTLAQKYVEYEQCNLHFNLSSPSYFDVVGTAMHELGCSPEWYILRLDNSLGNETSYSACSLLACIFDKLQSSNLEAFGGLSKAEPQQLDSFSCLTAALLCTSICQPEEYGHVAQDVHRLLFESGTCNTRLFTRLVQLLRAPASTLEVQAVKSKSLLGVLQACIAFPQGAPQQQGLEEAMEEWLQDLANRKSSLDSLLAAPFAALVQDIRFGAAGKGACLHELAQQSTELMEAALKSVPLWRTLEVSSEKREEVFQRMNTILAYFPCPVVSKTKPSSSAPERRLLLALCESAMISNEGFKRQQLLTGSSSQPSGSGTERQAAISASTFHSRILAAVFCYASQDMSDTFKKRANSHTRDLVRPVVVALEEAAESLGTATKKIASSLTQDSQGTKDAFETLKRLSGQLEGLALTDFKERLQPIEDALHKESELHETCAEAKCCLLAASHWLSLNLLGLQPSSTADGLVDDLISDILRCLLAVGCVCSIGQLLEDQEPLLGWLANLEAILEPLSAAGKALLSSPIPALYEAAQAMDEWASETGVDCVGACLGILNGENDFPVEIYGLVALALQLLMMPRSLAQFSRNLDEEVHFWARHSKYLHKPVHLKEDRLILDPVDSSLQSQAACAERPSFLWPVELHEGIQDEEEVAERQAQAEESQQSIPILMAYGLRSDIALFLCGVPTEGSEPMALWSKAQQSNTYLLVWAVVLLFILDLPADSRVRHSVSQGLHTVPGLLTELLDSLLIHLPLSDAKANGVAPSVRLQNKLLDPKEAARQAAEARLDSKQSYQTAAESLRAVLSKVPDLENGTLTACVYGAILRALPASARSWFQSISDKHLSSALEAYTISKESKRIISDELAGVSGHVTHGNGAEDSTAIELSAKAKMARREAVALVSLEGETVLELSIQLPESWPLNGAKIECRKGIGVAENRRRKWMLNITAMLRSQNVTLSDAISLWQMNCSRQFAGVEECLICYNVILAGTGQIPKLSCKTCSKKFHSACLFKWFRTSSKSACPHCQSPW